MRRRKMYANSNGVVTQKIAILSEPQTQHSLVSIIPLISPTMTKIPIVWKGLWFRKGKEFVNQSSSPLLHAVRRHQQSCMNTHAPSTL